MLTSSFPRDSRDETCGYIRKCAESLGTDFEVHVLVPPDAQAGRWTPESFALHRSWSLLPSRLEPFQSRRDLNLLTERLWMAIPLGWSLLLYFMKAAALALRADVICSHWLVPCGAVGSLLSLLYRKPHVIVEHSGALHLLMRRRVGRRVLRLIIRGAVKVVVVSEDLRCKLLSIAPEAIDKCEVARMGTDDRASGEPSLASRGGSSCRQIGFVGRLTEIKGLDVLLNAAEGLPEWRLVVAGEGEQKQRVEELAIKLKLNIEFVGCLDAVGRRKMLAECDAVVVPSLVLANGRTEGTPVVCLEALAAGRPVVASRVGGIPEIIVDGENGLLFSPGNAEELRGRLKLLFANQDLADKLAANGLQTSMEYGWRVLGPRFSEIIKGSIFRNDSTNYSGRLKAHGAKG